MVIRRLEPRLIFPRQRFPDLYFPRMPKVPSTLPTSALFAVAKPSGPTSMSLVNDVKKLVQQSRLFATEAELAKAKKSKNKNKSRFAKSAVPVGQGGTLDPLADGVLGN